MVFLVCTVKTNWAVFSSVGGYTNMRFTKNNCIWWEGRGE